MDGQEENAFCIRETPVPDAGRKALKRKCGSFIRAKRTYWGDKQAVIDLLLQHGAAPSLKDG